MAPKLNSHCWYDMKLAAAKNPDLQGDPNTSATIRMHADKGNNTIRVDWSGSTLTLAQLMLEKDTSPHAKPFKDNQHR